MNCVCLICFKPNDIWINFLSTFLNYDIYVIIDDNMIEYKEKYRDYDNINIIQIENQTCKENGYRNINFMIGKEISGWDKAIYYFSCINTKYNNIWFFEDDVFFYNESTLIAIDYKYNDIDLLSNKYNENLSGDKRYWNWKNINIQFPPPYYHAMVCIVRMSKTMISKIRDYIIKYNTMFFLEALFPTLCIRHKLTYKTPGEFDNIFWRKHFNNNDIDKTLLFHPIKDINKHIYYRDILLHLSTCKTPTVMDECVDKKQVTRNWRLNLTTLSLK